MGMFDTVKFRCPACGAVIVEQSKAGECTLHEYPSEDVPPDIAASIAGIVVRCGQESGDGCGKEWRIGTSMPTNIRLYLIPEE
jgi:hypothetical protein